MASWSSPTSGCARVGDNPRGYGMRPNRSSSTSDPAWTKAEDIIDEEQDILVVHIAEVLARMVSAERPTRMPSTGRLRFILGEAERHF